MNSSQENKKKLLILASRFPFPLDKGDKLRLYNQIKILNKSFDITLFAVSDHKIKHDQFEEVLLLCEHVEIVYINRFTQSFNILRCLFNGKPFQTGYFYSTRAKFKLNKIIRQKSFDHIYCQLIRMAEYVKEVHHIPKTIDYMDVLSEGIRKRIELQKGIRKFLFKQEALRLKKYEQHVFDYFEFHTIISSQDRQLISHPDQDKIVIVPNGVDESFFETNTVKSNYDFVFVGNMSYPPNVNAVKYIADEILPELPDSTLLVSGASPSKDIVARLKNEPNVHLSGWVDDIRTSYRDGKIFLAPMQIGTGQQNKILEAMASGLPVVTTSLSNNAIGGIHGQDLFVADTKNEFLTAISILINDEVQRKSIGNSGRRFVKENYSWSKSTAVLKDLLS